MKNAQARRIRQILQPDIVFEMRRHIIEDAAQALEPGTCAAVLVWENRWAAPVAVALRKSGGQLVASGRIGIQAVLAALELAEAQAEASSPS